MPCSPSLFCYLCGKFMVVWSAVVSQADIVPLTQNFSNWNTENFIGEADGTPLYFIVQAILVSSCVNYVYVFRYFNSKNFLAWIKN